MTISFEIPDNVKQVAQMTQFIAEYYMRPYWRQLDEHEHERPKEFVEQIWPILRDQQKVMIDRLKATAEKGETNGSGEVRKGHGSTRVLRLMMMIEILAWGWGVSADG